MPLQGHCLGSFGPAITRTWTPILSGIHRCSKRHTSAHAAFFERFYRIATNTTPNRPHGPYRPLSRHTPCTATGAARNCRNLSTGQPRLKRLARGQTPPRQPRHRGPLTPTRIPFGTLDQEELQTILKQEIPQDQGNQILRTLHERRANGSLIEYGTHIDGIRDVSSEAYEHALSWLREKYPLDEKAAATVWLGREMNKIEKTYIDRAERLGLYKRIDRDELRDKPQERSTADTSNSVIEEFKKYHERRRAREAQEEEARKQTPEYKQEQELQLAKVEEANKKQVIWEEKLAKRKALLAKQGMVSEATEAPQMSTLQRLAPATLFALATLFGCYFYANNYVPVTQDARLFPTVAVSVATVGTLVAINTAVTFLWRVPACQRTFNKFLLSCPGQPYALSMLGNIFSHQRFKHLSANMLTLVLFGVTVHEEIGRANFLALYVSGGVVGSVCSLFYFVARGILHTSHCGASGCTWAVMAAWAYLTLTNPPRSPESIDFASDVMRYMIIFIQILSHARRDIMQTVDVLAHATGALTGFTIAYDLRRGAVPARTAAKAEAPTAQIAGESDADAGSGGPSVPSSAANGASSVDGVDSDGMGSVNSVSSSPVAESHGNGQDAAPRRSSWWWPWAKSK